jgi:ABC-type transport system involved in multi-copper enzyme maturation permease subunit
VKVNAIRALAKGVVLESIRRKDLWVVAILGFLILAASGAMGLFGIRGLEIFVKDLAVTVLGLFSTIVTVITACRVLPDEIRNRTLYPLLARPISRLDLLVGKYVGAVVVSWIGFLALVALTGLALVTFGVHFEPVMAQYVIAKMMGLAVLCAVGLCLSAYMTPNAAATLTFLLAFGSTVFARALQMASAEQPGLTWLFRLLNAALPQTHLFDLGGRAVYLHWSPAPMWVMLALAAYMAVYVAATVGLGWLRFRRQAL